MAEISVDSLKRDPLELKLSKLISLKNELIGNQEKKELYFNQGIIETLLSMVGSEQNDKLLQEIVTVINCYFFDFPNSLECFKIYSPTFIQMHFFLQAYKDSPQLVDIVLKIIKNSITFGIVKVSDFENHSLIEELEPLMNSRSRISIIARIVALLCQAEHFRQAVAQRKSVLEVIL